MCQPNWQLAPLVITEHDPSGLQHAPVAGHGLGLHERFGCHFDGAAHPASVVWEHWPAELQHAPIGGHGAVTHVCPANQWHCTTSVDVPVTITLWHCEAGATKHAVFGQQHAPVVPGQRLAEQACPAKNGNPGGHSVLGTTAHPLATVGMQQAPVRMHAACEHGVLLNHFPPCWRHSGALETKHVPSGRQQAPFGHGAVAQEPLAIQFPAVVGQFACADA